MAIPLLLLPGLSCDARLWRDVIAGLGALAEVRVPDLGQDDTIAAMAGRVLRDAPERFALGGLSMGGYVSMEIMRQAPERVTHLALLDTSARPDDEARKEVRRAGMALAREGRFSLGARASLTALIAPHRMGTPFAEEMVAMFERVGPEAYLRQQTAIMNRMDSRPFLGDIKVPTLVGVGELDALTPPALSEEIVALIPHAELVRFAGSGHCSAAETPDAVVEAMRGWLRR